MAFRFTLDGLLRLRQSLEKAELQRLQRVAALIASTRVEIESVESVLTAARLRTFERVAGAGLTGADLHFEFAKESALNAVRSELLKKLSSLEQKRKEHQVRYVEARRQREVLSNLHKRQLADYQLDQSRRAQRQTDELFILRKISSAINETLPVVQNETGS